MQIRTLGGELSVSAMGFGAMGLSEFYGEAKDAHSLEVLKTVIDTTYERSINNQPDYIRQCCHESLQRLGVERIDLYYLHRVNPDASIEESMSCLSELVKEGKIAHVGLDRKSTH